MPTFVAGADRDVPNHAPKHLPGKHCSSRPDQLRRASRPRQYSHGAAQTRLERANRCVGSHALRRSFAAHVLDAATTPRPSRDLLATRMWKLR